MAPKLNSVKKYGNLGNIMSYDTRIDDEVILCIATASAQFGRLTNRLLHNRDIILMTKITVYCVVIKKCFSIRVKRGLDSFHTKSLPLIRGKTKYQTQMFLRDAANKLR